MKNKMLHPVLVAPTNAPPVLLLTKNKVRSSAVSSSKPRTIATAQKRKTIFANAMPDPLTRYPALTEGASLTQSRSSTALSIAAATSARLTLVRAGRATLTL